MALYKLLLFVHITTIAIWIGAGVMLTLQQLRAAKAGPPTAEMVLRNFEFLEWLGPHFYAPIILTTLATGIGLVLKAGYGFGHFFVLAGLGMALLGAGMGVGFFVPKAKALVAHIKEKGLDPEALAEMKTISLVSKGMIVLLILTVFVMTYKPFF